MAKTIQEINEKIKKGKAVVYTAEEIIDVVKSKGAKKAAAEVDVVTTGTFAPMCSSGALFQCWTLQSPHQAGWRHCDYERCASLYRLCCC